MGNFTNEQIQDHGADEHKTASKLKIMISYCNNENISGSDVANIRVLSGYIFYKDKKLRKRTPFRKAHNYMRYLNNFWPPILGAAHLQSHHGYVLR